MNRTGRTVLITAVSIIAAVGAIVVVVALLATDTEPKAENYRITQQDTSGNQRRIVVEVDTDDNLESVFADIVTTLDDEAGYLISINCSSGGSSSVDNRLANGRYAHGPMGTASTGLPEGHSEYERTDNTCP